MLPDPVTFPANARYRFTVPDTVFLSAYGSVTLSVNAIIMNYQSMVQGVHVEPKKQVWNEAIAITIFMLFISVGIYKYYTKEIKNI